MWQTECANMHAMYLITKMDINAESILSKKWKKKKHLDEKIYFYIGPAGRDESTNKSKLIWCDLAAGAVARVVINVVNDSVQIGILKNVY